MDIWCRIGKKIRNVSGFGEILTKSLDETEGKGDFGDSMEDKMPEELLESARVDHPQVVEELERLRLWVGTCIGVDIATWNGPKVDE